MQFTDTRFNLNTLVEACFGRYEDGSPALQLVEVDTGEPWATATVSIGPLPAGCVAIKSYSENQGMTALLVQAGVIEPVVVERHSSGFVTIPVHRLTPAALRLAAAA